MSSLSNQEKCVLAINEAVQILGGKWSLFVLGQLLFKSPQRFSQLQKNLDDINTRSLTDTLRYLEKNEMIIRQVYPTVPITVEYHLSKKGKSFEKVLLEMHNWTEHWRGSQVDGG